jgi:xylan 1,4-beta-xylosidase
MRKVDIKIDTAKTTGPLDHIWRFIGYDECNYTTTPEGEELLAKFGNLPDAPYYVRAHHLFCNGNGQCIHKWGSTNIYTEDRNGQPVYNYTEFDKIIETIIKHGNIPFVELGFMPLQMARQDFRSSDKWEFGTFYEYKVKGWSMPPADYTKWQELVYECITHCIARWGKENVEKWYFELWNEPDLMNFYWSGTLEEFNKLYDYTEAAVHQALPTARLAGPATTGPLPGSSSAEFLDGFLKHCQSGTNYVTGATGTRLDYVSFHVKGGGFEHNPHPEKGSPSIKLLMDQVRTGCEIIKENGYGDREVVLSECDPDGWAAGGRFDNFNLNFRNTEYYATFIASSYHHIRKLGEEMKMEIKPLAWAFLFPGERCFEGTRVFSTRGIDKASFNIFKMLAKQGDHYLSFDSDGEGDAYAVVKENADVSGFASGSLEGCIRILVYSHHDDPEVVEKSEVTLTIAGLSGSTRNLRHERIDATNSNAYHPWVLEGMPDYPDAEQYARIKAKDSLTCIDSYVAEVAEGVLTIRFEMPAHGISLLELT